MEGKTHQLLVELINVINKDDDGDYFICQEAAGVVDDIVKLVGETNGVDPIVDPDSHEARIEELLDSVKRTLREEMYRLLKACPDLKGTHDPTNFSLAKILLCASTGMLKSSYYPMSDESRNEIKRLERF